MKIIKYIKDPIRILIGLDNHKIIHLSDKEKIRLEYKLHFGKYPNLKNPQTFNEKLQWLKLHDRKESYSKMVDKYDVKDYVSKIIGEEYIIPTIGLYNKFEEIDFENLPNQFVIKCTHDSGGLVICKDKTNFDLSKAKKIINHYLKRDFYIGHREWAYKNVKPRVIVEKYMEDKETKELRDYKFFCFNGKCKLMFIATDRQAKTETCFDFFDENFNHLDFTNGHPNAKTLPKKPLNFNKMIELSEKISENIPQVRIDWYEINGKIYFGEITFCHWGGLVPFKPDEWDYKIGQWIDLSLVNKNEK